MSESREFSELADLDVFFFYGEVDLEHETQHDIALGLLQPGRSLYYDREDSAGVDAYENVPNDIFLTVVMRYDIAAWMARRNRFVGDGTDGSKDRRVAVSQSSIDIKQRKDEVDVTVLYIPFSRLQQPQQLSIPLGGQSG